MSSRPLIRRAEEPQITPNRFFFVGIAFVVTILLFISSNKISNPRYTQPLSAEEAEQLEQIEPIREAFQEYRDCFLQQYFTRKSLGDYRKNVWIRGIPNITNHCMNKSILNKIPLTPLSNKDETKFHIFTEKTDPSTIVTLGVGADVLVEQELLLRLPKGSELFAADPIYVPNAKLFEPIGTFFPLAVGSEIGISEASIRKENGLYEKVKIPHVDFVTFIKKFINKPVIDQLLLDNEGPEYELLGMFVKGGILDTNDITICQMNAEVHNFARKIESFPSLFEKVLRDGRFLPIHAEYAAHQRLYFINTESYHCIQKYVLPFLQESLMIE